MSDSRSPLRGVFVGTGEQANWIMWHAVARVPEVQVVAGYDRSEPAVARFCDTHSAHGLTPYNDLRRMMEEQTPDLVWICTPPGSHADVLGRVLDLAPRDKIIGIDCQKPSTTTIAHHDAMTAAARAVSAVLTYSYDRTFSSALQLVAAIVERELIGDVTGGNMDWLRFDGIPRRRTLTDRVTAGGGVDFDLLPHLVAELIAIGLMPEAVSATSSRHAVDARGSRGDLNPEQRITVDDAISGTFHLGDRRSIAFTTMWDVPVAKDRMGLELYGTRGSVSLAMRQLPGDPEREGTADEVLEMTGHVMIGGQRVTLTPAEPARTLAECRAAQLTDLVRVIMARRAGVLTAPVVTPERARDTLRVVLAAARSAQQGGQIVPVTG